MITDLEMPRVNGYELIENLRHRASTQDVPVMVLTTRAGEKHWALARRLGVRHYVARAGGGGGVRAPGARCGHGSRDGVQWSPAMTGSRVRGRVARGLAPPVRGGVSHGQGPARRWGWRAAPPGRGGSRRRRVRRCADAATASVALTALEWSRPDVVVSREDVPELDGYELLQRRRSDPSTKALPFLLLTSPAGPRAGAAARARVDMVLGGTFDSADIVNRVQGSRPPEGTMPKVLIVDDSLTVRKVVERILESRQLQVLQASLGTEAIERIQHDEPDLVVCDVLLPDEEGCEVCQFVKSHPGSTGSLSC